MVRDIIKYLSRCVRIFFPACPLGAPGVPYVPPIRKAASIGGFRPPIRLFIAIKPAFSDTAAAWGLCHVASSYPTIEGAKAWTSGHSEGQQSGIKLA